MKKIILVIILLTLCNTAVADKWWTGDAGNLNWFAPNNWTDGDSNAVPSNPESARVLVPYGTGTWPILNNGTADPNLCIVGGTWGHPGRLVVAAGGTLNTNLDMWIGENDPCSAFDPCGIGMEALITGGSVNIGQHLSIGKVADAKFAQSGGSVSVYNDTFVGQGTSLGTVEITGGDFETWNMWVHQSKFVIDGGDVVVGSEFHLACDTNREPNMTELQMKSGTLTITYGNLAFGHSNIAKCIQTGGSIDTYQGTYLGACAGWAGIDAYGTYELKGGSMDTWGMYIYHGKLIIDGGTMNVGQDLHITDVNNGEPNNLVDELQIKSGTLTVGNNFAIGNFGEANCVMSGGNLFVSNGVLLGISQSAVGQMEMSDGNLVANTIFVGGGWGDATQGFWDMTGGDITLYSNDHGLMVSNQGPSTPEPNGTESVFTMDGGTIDTPVLIVGRQGTGKFLMTDGTVDISDKLWIGIHDDPVDGFYIGREGLVELYGGQINVAVDVGCDNNEPNNGTLDICGGTLVLDGDRTSDVAGWITEGWLIACNGNANIIYDYGVTNPGKTTVISDCNGLPAGNLNDDCKVDFRDFTILADHWLEDAGLNCTSYPVGDLDESCIVDIYDLAIIVKTWLDDTYIL